MLLFVGLGNPTPDSENNRHNVGFKIIDTINKKFSLSKQKPKFKGLLTTGNIEGEEGAEGEVKAAEEGEVKTAEGDKKEGDKKEGDKKEDKKPPTEKK